MINEKLQSEIEYAISKGIKTALNEQKVDEGWKQALLGGIMGASVMAGGNNLNAANPANDNNYDNQTRTEMYSEYQQDSIGRKYIRSFYDAADKADNMYKEEIDAFKINATYRSHIITMAAVRGTDNNPYVLDDQINGFKPRQRAEIIRQLLNGYGDDDVYHYCLIETGNGDGYYIVHIPTMVKIAKKLCVVD